MNKIMLFSKRNIKEILRDPTSLVFLFIMPFVMLIMFYYLFHSMTSQFEIKMLAPAMISFSHVFLCLFIAILLSGDRESSFITRLYTTPLKSRDFILGYAFSVVPIGILQTVMILIVASIIDSSFFSISILLCIPFSIVSVLLFIGLGILFGSLCNQKSVGGICSIVIMDQSLLSGMWFPLEELSDGFIKIIEILPFRSGSLLFQNLCYSQNGLNGILKPFLILLAYGVASIIISIIIYKSKMDNK